MKLRLRKRWNSVVPLQLRARSGVQFCMFQKVRKAGRTPGNTPVYLNVYDLTPMNGYILWAGLGVFHSGVEVHGVEYAFGAHEYSSSGVFEVEPRRCPGFRFRKSIFMGTTCLDPIQAREFMELQSVNYNGDTYHLILKNCNHFSENICYQLTGNHIPKWVNRLARIGSLCNCLLPEALRSPRHNQLGLRDRDVERRRMRSAISCLSSMSVSKKHLAVSSVVLHSPLKGCLPPWAMRTSSFSMRDY